VIAGDTVASLPFASDSPLSSLQEDRVRVMRLEHEAVVEHARLVRARAFLASNHRGPLVVPAAGQAVAFARRRRLRSALGSHLIVIVESRLEDAAGRAVAS